MEFGQGLLQRFDEFFFTLYNFRFRDLFCVFVLNCLNFEAILISWMGELCQLKSFTEKAALALYLQYFAGGKSGIERTLLKVARVA